MIKLSRTIVVIALLAVFLSVTVGCDRHGEAWERMDRAERLMNSRPDSALLILDSVRAETLGDKKERARYALLKSMALDKNYIDTIDFKVLQPAIDYYLKHGTADEKLRTYYYQGRIYQNGKDNASAMRSFMRGREYIGEATDTMTVANLLVAQGTIFYTVYKLDDFTRVNLESAKLYHDLGRIDYEMLNLANALCGCMMSDNRFLADSILSVIKEKTQRYPEYSSSVSYSIVTYMATYGDKEEITDFLRQYDSGDDVDDATKMAMAVAYCEIGDLVNAKRMLDLLPPTSVERTTLKYPAIMSEIKEGSGDYEGALKEYRKFFTDLDSVYQEIFTHDLLFAQDRHDLEQSNMRDVRKRDRIILIVLCVTFLLFLIICLVYYRYRLGKTRILLDEQEKMRLELEREYLEKKNRNLELERENAVLEKRTADIECEHQSLVAENLRLRIKELEAEGEILRGVLEERKDLDAGLEDAIKERLEMLNGLLAARITENESYSKPYEEWRERLIEDKNEFMKSTRLAFRATHPEFIRHLESHGLTEAEINYVCLYALGLRGKEIGDYMEIKRHYHVSGDIRRKLGIAEHNTNLGNYIRSLMQEHKS